MPNVTFSPDGKYLATLDDLGFITLINVANQQEINTFYSGCESVANLTKCWLVFSPDGKYLGIDAYSSSTYPASNVGKFINVITSK